MTESPAAQVAKIEGLAERLRTPCGDGEMVWRAWGAGEALVLLHGAFGSWTHWIRNVLPLAERFRVLAPDMPGYGRSAMPPEPYGPESLATIIAEGIDRLLPPGSPYHLAGFSFGGIIAGHVAARHGTRVANLVLIGPNGMALPRGETRALRRIEPEMGAAEIAEVHRHNLAVLMIADPAMADDLAVHIQVENARHARVRSGRIPESDALLRVLPDVRARISGIWGGRDAMAVPHIGMRRETLSRFQPDLDFRVVPGAGHWVPFEVAATVNAALAEILSHG